MKSDYKEIAVLPEFHPQAEIHNNTPFSLPDIRNLPFIGLTVNKWRGRNVYLLQHPAENYVVSVGITFNQNMVVIAVEHKDQWKTSLDYIKKGMVYVRE